MITRFYKFLVVFFCTLVLLSCVHKPKYATENGKIPAIFPDYTDLTIPPNIAPLNFAISDSADDFFVEIYGQKGSPVSIHTQKVVDIPIKKWRRLLSENKGDTLFVDIYRKTNGRWEKYLPIKNIIAIDTIDPYMAYRQSAPGDGYWRHMEIRQRNLTNFTDAPIIVNDMADGACFSCHITSGNNPNNVMLHVRRSNPGTLIIRNGELRKVKMTIDNQNVIYGAWHPSANFLAFSTNEAASPDRNFSHERMLVVYDRISDIVLYNIENNELSSDSFLLTPNYVESFPTWSHDGNYLYYCRANSPKNPEDSDDYEGTTSVMYDLMRIAFDEQSGCFTGSPEKMIDAQSLGLSVSLPEVSPDDRYVMFAASDYGTITPAAKRSDLFLLDLKTKKVEALSILNTKYLESSHAWSNNGRWFLYSSKKGNGLYSRPYLGYFDKNGHVHKSFIVPQKDPFFYPKFRRLYNLPRLMTGPINPEWMMEANHLEARPVVNKLEHNYKSVDAVSGATQKH